MGSIIEWWQRMELVPWKQINKIYPIWKKQRENKLKTTTTVSGTYGTITKELTFDSLKSQNERKERVRLK